MFIVSIAEVRDFACFFSGLHEHEQMLLLSRLERSRLLVAAGDTDSNTNYLHHRKAW